MAELEKQLEETRKTMAEEKKKLQGELEASPRPMGRSWGRS